MPLARRSVLAGLVAALCWPAGRAVAEADWALVMYRRRGCPWCKAWDRDIGAIYPLTDLGARFPLREVDLDREGDGGIELARPVRYTPTFVLVRGAREIARIEGYPGEDFFWARLERMAEEHAPADAADASPATRYEHQEQGGTTMVRSSLAATLIGGALAVATGPALAQGAAGEYVALYTVEGNFEDVRLDLENAIINRGLVIDYEAFVGAMLNRTAEDVGAETQVYTHADTLQFCSATLSRRTMEADPVNLAFCPYIVFVYELADAEGEIHVGYRRLPEAGDEESRAALFEVNALLDEIVREVVGEDAIGD